MLKVLGPDRFRQRQAQGSGSVSSAPEKRKVESTESQASIRRGCLADWMELSVHVNPSLRQTRQRPLPRGLQDRYASSVRQYLTQAMLQKGKELNSRRPVEAAGKKKQVALQVQQVHEGPEGILIRAQVVQGCLSCEELPQGSSVRLLLHQKHPALQALQLWQGTMLQVSNFSLVQDTGSGSLLLPTEIHALGISH